MNEFIESCFDFFDSFMDSFFGPVPVTNMRSKACRKCGRVYKTSDEAALCSDWDNVLGTKRHSDKR